MRRTFIIVAAVLIVLGVIAGYALLIRRAPIRDAEVTTLQLEGRLLLAHITQGVMTLDLATGETRTLYPAPSKAWVTGASLSPDGSTIVFSYAPPEGPVQYGFSDLYTIPAAGSDQPALLLDASTNEVLYAATWSPEGPNIYFTHSQPGETGAFELSVERIPYPAGQPEIVVEPGFAPAVSPDGSSLAYVVTQPSGSDALYLAAIDGADVRPLAPDAGFNIIDRPCFSPDGSKLIVSAFKPLAARSFEEWVNTFLGVRIAQANTAQHGAPSDIWQIDVMTGAAEMLAELRAEGIALDYSPDGRSIAFITGQGIFIMDADGSRLTRIAEQTGYRSVQWID